MSKTVNDYAEVIKHYATSSMCVTYAQNGDSWSDLCFSPLSIG